MKKAVYLFLLSLPLSLSSSYAQAPVTDVAHISTAIENSLRTLKMAGENIKVLNTVHNEIRKQVKNFEEVRNIGLFATKAYEGAREVRELADIYQRGFRLLSSDRNFSVAEKAMIARNYGRLVERSTDTFRRMRILLTSGSSGLHVGEGDRYRFLCESVDELSEYRRLSEYYTRKMISLSLARADKRHDMKYWQTLYSSYFQKQ